LNLAAKGADVAQKPTSLFPHGMFGFGSHDAAGNPQPLKPLLSGKPIILPNSSIRGEKPGITAMDKKLFSPKFTGLASGSQGGATGGGEIIAATYHTYNSIATLAPLVSQDENLSLTLNSKNVKIFVNPNQNAIARNLICFVENSMTTSAGNLASNAGVDASSEDKGHSQASPKVLETSNNISFLVNQDEQISNVLSANHSKGKLQGTILDFTVRQFRYLYLLYAKSIVILDFRDLLNSKVNGANDMQIVESIQL